MLSSTAQARAWAVLCLLLGPLLVLLPLHACQASVLASAAELRVAVQAEQARARAPLIERAVFLARPTFGQAQLSPDGQYVAWVRDQGNERSVWIMPTTQGEPRRLLGNAAITGFDWSADSRWLLLQSERQVQAVAVAGQPGSGTLTPLGGARRRSFLGIDSSQPAAVLVSERPAVIARPGETWQLLRVDVEGRQTLLHEDEHPLVDAAFTADGRLAFLLRAEGEGHVLLRVDANGKLHELARLQRMQRLFMLGTLEAGRALLVQSSYGGDLDRLQRVDGDGRWTELHRDPRGEADLTDVLLHPSTGEPLLAAYRSTLARNHALQPALAAPLRALEQRLRQDNLRIEIGSTPAAPWLVHERSGHLRAERLHLYWPDSGKTRELLADAGFESGQRLLSRPPPAQMAHKLAMRWRASDGRQLFGFLHLPPGVDVRQAPLLASVHGGPFNRARPEFSNDAQFLANRGYIVFEPNFRGSTGYGREYLFSARGDFGNGRVQRDIVEGVQWLLANGIGDAQRVGLIGASFGGYSTLLGLTFQPELFKVGIAAVPPADFGWVLREYLGLDQTLVPGVPMAASMRHLDLDPADPDIAARLREQSPMANAARMQRPLLMLAGGEDERVPIRGVNEYAARLKQLGKDVSLFVDPEGGHSPSDTRTREAYYFLMETLLHRHLQGPAPIPADTVLAAHLKRNLRLRGASLDGLPSPPSSSTPSAASSRFAP